MFLVDELLKIFDSQKERLSKISLELIYDCAINSPKSNHALIISSIRRSSRYIKIFGYFLISNQAKLASANALRKYFNIPSKTTVNDYLYFLNDCYLFQSIPKFSFSHKA
jgi:predicted AAA+ superfamily ATPase